MKTRPIALCLLASVSTTIVLAAPADLPPQSQQPAKLVLALPLAVPAEKPVEPPIQLDVAVRTKFATAVQAQILQQLNPPIPISDRFSRVMRPMPLRYYATEIASKDADGVIGFRVVCYDRTNGAEPVRTVYATGKFKNATDELTLLDPGSGKYVPVSEHPQFRKSPNT